MKAVCVRRKQKVVVFIDINTVILCSVIFSQRRRHEGGSELCPSFSAARREGAEIPVPRNLRKLLAEHAGIQKYFTA